jgi:Tol biopolymer transport system component
VVLPPEIQVNSPTISPDGRMVAFDDAQVYGEGAEAIVVASLDRGDTRPLLRGVNLTSGLVWSPDSRRLAYAAWTGKPGGPCLFVISVRSGRVTRLTSHPIRAHDSGPVWSPDGRSLLFSRGTPTGQRTLLVDVRTRALRTLPAARDRPTVFNLSWQPHGHLIAAQQGFSDSAPIVVTTTRSARFRQLSAELNGTPLGWSTDGRFLLVRQVPAPSPPSSGPVPSLPPPPVCADLLTYDVKTKAVTRIACAGPATWERGVDRVLYTWLNRTSGGMFAESSPARLWSITATGRDRHLITRNAAFVALPTLSGISDG